MSSGFLENENDVVLSNHDYATSLTYWGGSIPLIPLEGDKYLGLPSGMVRWSHVELVIEHGDEETDVAAAQCRMMITWDAEGDNIAAGPTQNFLSLTPGRTTNKHYMVSGVLDVSPTLPPDGSRDVIYLWVQTLNLGTTATVKKARMYWHDMTKG